MAAIHSSYSDWSLASTKLPQSTHKHHNLCDHSPRHLQCSKFLKHVVSSSASTSPETLQESSSIIPTTSFNHSIILQAPPELDIQELNQNIRDLLLKGKESEELGWKLYKKAKLSSEFVPENTTLNQVVKYLVTSQKWDSVAQIVGDFRKYGLFPASSVCANMISSCIKARKFRILDSILDVFVQSDSRMSVMAFDVAMRGYNGLHMYTSTVKVYEKMRSANVELDSGIYCRIMEAYLKIGEHGRVIELFREFESLTFMAPTSNPAKIYAVLFESLGRSGKAFQALEIFRKMGEKGVREDSSIYACLVSTFASIHEVTMAEELFGEAMEKKMVRDPAIFLKMVLMYIETGMLGMTVEVVRAMKEAKVGVSDCICCAIVNAYSKKVGLQAAIGVYNELLLEGCEPGQVTYASMLNVYIRIGLYSKAEELFIKMDQKGFDKCVVAYSSMIAMYGKTGRLKDAMRLLAKMKERGCKPNVWIYNALMDMHGRDRNLRQVEKIWSEMKRRKIVPDKVSYTCIIGSYCKAKEFDTCVKYYNEFRINGGHLDRALAGIMVGIFSRLDRVDELVKLLQDMKSEGTELDGRLYWSAFNALRDAGLVFQAKWLQDSFKPAESKT